MIPEGVRGAWEREIPRHDLIGYIKMPEIWASGVADSDSDAKVDAPAPIIFTLMQKQNEWTSGKSTESFNEEPRHTTTRRKGTRHTFQQLRVLKIKADLPLLQILGVTCLFQVYKSYS